MQVSLSRPSQEVYNFLWLHSALSTVHLNAMNCSGSPTKDISWLRRVAKEAGASLEVLALCYQSSEDGVLQTALFETLFYLLGELHLSTTTLAWQYNIDCESLSQSLYSALEKLHSGGATVLYGNTHVLTNIEHEVTKFRRGLLGRDANADLSTRYILKSTDTVCPGYLKEFKQVQEESKGAFVTEVTEKVSEAEFFLYEYAANTVEEVLKAEGGGGFEVCTVSGVDPATVTSFATPLGDSEPKGRIRELTTEYAWQELLQMMYIQIYRTAESNGFRSTVVVNNPDTGSTSDGNRRGLRRMSL